MYPVVSKIEIHVNNITNCGMKLSTEPTPEIIPSTIKLFNQFAIPILFNNVFVVLPNRFIIFSFNEIVNFPTTPTDK